MDLISIFFFFFDLLTDILTPLHVLFLFVFTFLAVLYLRYLSTGISLRAIDGEPIIFAKVSPPGNYGC